jgi:hypothetical protein
MRFRHSILAALAPLGVCALIPAAAAAQQRPLSTADPETVGTNRVLIEGGFELDRAQLYPEYGLKGDTTHGPTFGVTVGLSPNAEVEVDGGLRQQLHVTERKMGPLSSVLSFTGDSASTFEDFTVATKIRLRSEGATRPAFGVRFGSKLPTAQQQKGMGLGTTDFFAALLIGKTVRSVRTVGNVGLLVLGNPESAQGAVRALGFGLSVARALTDDFEVVGELNGHLKPSGKTVPPGTDSRGVVRLAGRYTHQLLRLDVGILVGITPRDPAFGISAGVTYVIGK